MRKKVMCLDAKFEFKIYICTVSIYLEVNEPGCMMIDEIFKTVKSCQTSTHCISFICSVFE